jgi:sarcosine oxidase
MEEQRVDVAVVGCGGAGAATAWWLAKRGRTVVAIDRFEPAHRRGSSHGTERIVRAAYADPVYVELALAALPLWRELEREAGVQLLTPTGGIDFGPVEELTPIATACTAAGVALEWLERAEAGRRFPGFRFTGPVVYQPGTGTVHAERAVAAMQRCAVRNGATVHFGEEVVAIDASADSVVIQSDRRRLRADTCVVTTGAWAAATAGALIPLPAITVTQEQVAFFRPNRSEAGRDAGGAESGRHGWPAFLDPDDPTVYGMRTPDGLVKVGEHYTGPVVDPDRRDFALEPQTWKRLLAWVEQRLPGVDPTPVADTTCLYATAPGEDFVLDRIGRVVVGAGLGGHGFKFLPEIGRRLADLADGLGAPGPFALHAPARGAGPPGHR